MYVRCTPYWTGTRSAPKRAYSCPETAGGSRAACRLVREPSTARSTLRPQSAAARDNPAALHGRTQGARNGTSIPTRSTAAAGESSLLRHVRDAPRRQFAAEVQARAFDYDRVLLTQLPVGGIDNFLAPGSLPFPPYGVPYFYERPRTSFRPFG